MTNGANTEPLSGWAIVLAGGTRFVGRCERPAAKEILKAVLGDDGEPIAADLRPETLSPFYALDVNITPGEQRGQIRVNYMCTPLLMFASLESIDVPEGAIVIPCERLSHGERRRLNKAVREAEDAIQVIRAADAGVLTARSMPVRDR